MNLELWAVLVVFLVVIIEQCWFVVVAPVSDVVCLLAAGMKVQTVDAEYLEWI